MSKAGSRPAWLKPQLLIEIPAVIVTFAMMAHITVNALLRTFKNEPVANTLEITQYWYLPIIAFLGFIAAQARGQHIAADLIYERLPDCTKRYVLAVLSVLAAVICAGFAKYGWEEAVHAHEIEKTAGVTEVAAWQPYYLVPLAFGVMTIQLLWSAGRALIKGDDQHVLTDPDDAMLLEELEEMQAREAQATADAKQPTDGGTSQERQAR